MLVNCIQDRDNQQKATVCYMCRLFFFFSRPPPFRFSSNNRRFTLLSRALKSPATRTIRILNRDRQQNNSSIQNVARLFWVLGPLFFCWFLFMKTSLFFFFFFFFCGAFVLFVVYLSSRRRRIPCVCLNKQRDLWENTRRVYIERERNSGSTNVIIKRKSVEAFPRLLWRTLGGIEEQKKRRREKKRKQIALSHLYPYLYPQKYI